MDLPPQTVTMVLGGPGRTVPPRLPQPHNRPAKPTNPHHPCPPRCPAPTPLLLPAFLTTARSFIRLVLMFRAGVRWSRCVGR
jgi:hypothetical protein